MSGPTTGPATGPAQPPEKPTPRRHLLLGAVALAALLGGFGAWSVGTRIDGAIIAHGQVQVYRNRQVIQHIDGGIVAEILVAEGQDVAAGEPLIRLDGVLLHAELAIIETQLFELQARRARLEAERDGRPDMSVPAALIQAAAASAEVAEQLDGQRRLFLARAETVDRTVEQLDRRKIQTLAQIDGIDAQIAATARQLDLVRRELTDLHALQAQGLVQSSRVLALEREEVRLLGVAGDLQSQRAQNEGRLTETDLEILRLRAQRREEANDQLRDIGTRELELAERRRAQIERISRLEIRSPVAGRVLGLQVTTPRSVIRPADTVMHVVPQDRPLIVVARVPTIHIADVRVDQRVRIVLSALQDAMMPDVYGRVSSVSADTLTDQATGMQYYHVEITMTDEDLRGLGGRTLLPGMPVDSFFQTGSRTPLAYLLQPFTHYFDRAFRES